MDVHLSADLERLVQEKVESGRYRSAHDVISQALHALDERDQELDARTTAFKTEIERRLASGPATPMDFPALKRRIREEVEARKIDPRDPESVRAPRLQPPWPDSSLRDGPAGPAASRGCP
jgi:antitoxin ParD1/3/4